jgi:hypothetical protein
MEPFSSIFISFEWTLGLQPARVIRALLPQHLISVWFALEQNAPSPLAMERGINGAQAFVFFATDGALLKPNVRHEVACAVASNKRVIILFDKEGPPLEVIFAQGGSYWAPLAASTPPPPGVGAHTRDAEGRRLLSPDALSTFQTNCLATIGFFRDTRMLTEALPTLVAELLPLPPWRLIQPTPLGFSSDCLLVSASDGAMHTLYVFAGLARARCGLALAVLPPRTPADVAATAAHRARAVVAVLTVDAWADAGFVAAVTAKVNNSAALVLMHERAAEFGGADIALVRRATPQALQRIYHGVNGVISFRLHDGMLPQVIDAVDASPKTAPGTKDGIICALTVVVVGSIRFFAFSSLNGHAGGFVSSLIGSFVSLVTVTMFFRAAAEFGPLFEPPAKGWARGFALAVLLLTSMFIAIFVPFEAQPSFESFLYNDAYHPPELAPSYIESYERVGFIFDLVSWGYTIFWTIAVLRISRQVASVHTLVISGSEQAVFAVYFATFAIFCFFTYERFSGRVSAAEATSFFLLPRNFVLKMLLRQLSLVM